jgi:hypothetical protein
LKRGTTGVHTQSTNPTLDQSASDGRIAASTGKAHTLFRRIHLVSTMVALIMLMSLNAAVQMNRAYWDNQNDIYGALGRLHDCEQAAKRIDVLFTGSSRVEHGVDASAVDSAYQLNTGRSLVSCNIGTLGSTFEEDFVALKRLYRDGAAPKLIVENLWEYNLNAHANPTTERLEAVAGRVRTIADLSDADEISDQYGHGVDQVAGQLDFAASKLVALYGDRSALLAWACSPLRIKSIKPCDAPPNMHGGECYTVTDGLGTCLIERPAMSQVPANERQAPAPARYEFVADGIHNFAFGGHQVDYLTKFVRLAQAHQARVIFVISPLHPLYFTYFDHPSVWPTIVAYWQTYASAEGIPFYDASHLPGFTDSDFSDPHHLTISGARKFSTWMAGALVKPNML